VERELDTCKVVTDVEKDQKLARSTHQILETYTGKLETWLAEGKSPADKLPPPAAIRVILQINQLVNRRLAGVYAEDVDEEEKIAGLMQQVKSRLDPDNELGEMTVE